VRLDAVGLEVMAHAFASVAEEMGLVLVHSALSPNIRERRDASAALFDADGEMIAQAAHIPVHLGALADAVAAVRQLDPTPGELFLLNDPYAGGSHLPDLTLIGAIDVDGQVGGYSVVRAHHSDVGGMTAGSMPAGARELYQEGRLGSQQIWSDCCSPTCAHRPCGEAIWRPSVRPWSGALMACGHCRVDMAGASSARRHGSYSITLSAVRRRCSGG
jgi:hypothetical protein